MGENLNVILTILTIASTLGAASGIFYGVRNKTIIATLKESNDAYKERNVQLEDKVDKLEKKAIEQDTKINMLIEMKSPDLNDLKDFLAHENEQLAKRIIKGKL